MTSVHKKQAGLKIFGNITSGLVSRCNIAKYASSKRQDQKQLLNRFHATGLFLYPLKTYENLWFYDDIKGYGIRKTPAKI